jgi:hypothetical protein
VPAGAVAVLDALLPGVAEAGAATYLRGWLERATPSARRQFRAALATLDELAQARYARRLGRLHGQEVAALVEELARRAEQDTWSPTAEAFWLLRLRALEAAFAHPRYGGNRGGWGWRLVGAHGEPQPRGYTIAELESGAILPPEPALELLEPTG